MRICLINYRYFVSSGPERYLFGIKRLLEEQGHEVVPFSVRYRANEPSPWSAYFVEPIAGDDEVRFFQHTWTGTAVRRALERAVYSTEVYSSLSHLVEDARPDVAFVLHYLRKLSPSVLACLRDHKVPVVVRLSDFAMVCPQAHLVRDGRVCEDCVGRGYWPSIRYRCVQNSLGASVVNAVALWHGKLRGYFDVVDAFVVPSSIMQVKMVEGGWPGYKMIRIPTFVEPQPRRRVQERREQICYVGRIDAAKGVETLLEAHEMLRRDGRFSALELVMAGDTGNPDCARLCQLASRGGLPGVTMAGTLDREEVIALFSESLASIVPSIWYENLPNSLLESLACGTPVVASDLGSLKEAIDGTGAGLLAPPGDARGLATIIARLLEDRDELEKASVRAHALARDRYSPEAHREALVGLFERAVADRCN
ncbi:MAG TPA: glycosyltransferase family 4 protein [Thermoleophilia bacterium]|nr:glycosyltransferase family 4 protein [Thermoleophilia bacterium]